MLAACLQSKEAYSSILSVREDTDFSEQGLLLMQEIDAYYDKDASAPSVDRDLLMDVIARRYPKSAKLINAVVSDLGQVSTENVTQEYIELKKEALEHLLAETILSGEDYGHLVEKLLTVESIEEEQEQTVYVNADLDDILATVAPENLIKVDPPSLNERLDGGVIPGTQMAIYAPTEVGKSMIAINMACGFLREGYRVYYGGNEDPAKSMLLRFYCNLSGMDKHDIVSNPRKARATAMENGFGNLIFKELQPGSLREIRMDVDKYSPDIVFIDQMANMECRSQSKVEKNEILACGLRAMAKRFNFVSIILHQASDDAYGKLILEKNHMYYSNVGVQGQMDVMIGVGMDSSYEQQSLRMLCLTKNKISGNHDNFPVHVEESLSRVRE